MFGSRTDKKLIMFQNIELMNFTDSSTTKYRYKYKCPN